MTVYFAGASYADISYTLNEAPGISRGLYASWGNASGGTRYNSNLLRGYTSLTNTEYENLISIGTDVSDLWFHADIQADSNRTLVDQFMVAFYGSSLNFLHAVVGQVTASPGTFNLRPSTDGVNYATAYTGTNFTRSLLSLTTWDIHLKIDASAGEFAVYQGGSLVSSFSGDTRANGSNLVRYIRLGSAATGNLAHWSGIIVANESTIGWKAQELYPVTGAQSFSGWTGDYSVVDDYAWAITKTDSAYANANNDTVSYAANNTHSSVSTMVPVALALSARAFKTEDSAVSGLELGVSIGGTYYGSGTTKTLTPSDGDYPVQQILHTNPSNSSAWSLSDLDSLQIAMRAKT